jgi:hypothetical protein
MDSEPPEFSGARNFRGGVQRCFSRLMRDFDYWNAFAFEKGFLERGVGFAVMPDQNRKVLLTRREEDPDGVAARYLCPMAKTRKRKLPELFIEFLRSHLESSQSCALFRRPVER